MLLTHIGRNDDLDAAASVNTAGWTAFPGNPYQGGSSPCNISLFWKIGDGAETTVSATATGGATNDQRYAIVSVFSAADGFATNPIEAIVSASQTDDTPDAPTVVPGGANRLGVSVLALDGSDASIADFTGESGGDWTEAYQTNQTTGGDSSNQLQTADLSGGGTISGGSMTAVSASNWCVVGFALVPAATGATVVLDTGDLALTGSAATLTRRVHLTASSAAFALSGTATDTQSWNHVLDGGAGTFTLSGTAAVLAKTFQLSAETGSFALSGTDATARRDHVLTAPAGAFELSGQSAGTTKGFALSAEGGTLALTGADAGLRRDHVLVAPAGAFELTGMGAALTRAFRVVAGGGALVLTGSDATLIGLGGRLAAGSGAFALGGQPAALRHNYVLLAAGQTWSDGTGWDDGFDWLTLGLYGSDATLSTGKALAGGAGSATFTLSGQDATFAWTHVLAADAGVFALTGLDATLTHMTATYTLSAGAGAFALTGSSASAVHGAGGQGGHMVLKRRRGR